jgi:hypothetical protein
LGQRLDEHHEQAMSGVGRILEAIGSVADAVRERLKGA